MSKSAALDHEEARHKAQAERYLVETKRILRQLATERQREERRRVERSNLLSEVKAILHGA